MRVYTNCSFLKKIDIHAQILKSETFLDGLSELGYNRIEQNDFFWSAVLMVNLLLRGWQVF